MQFANSLHHMQLIKVDATDSTNAYLKKMMLQKETADFTVVLAQNQYAGRGQMGTRWLSEPGKNLTFSILKKHKNLYARNQFGITMLSSLGVYKALNQFLIPDLHVKWPNDILSGPNKICGILIENMTSGQQVQASVIGIGLNVNQTDFGPLEQVSSLKGIMGRAFDLEVVLQGILTHLQHSFGHLETRSAEEIRNDYESHLFRKDKPSAFRQEDGTLFMGFIRGVSDEGKLRVELENDEEVSFDMKEVQLLY